MSIKDGGPAFPHLNPNYDGNWVKEPQRGGMSLRDYFAGQALAGLLPKVPFMAGTHEDLDEHVMRSARGAYHYADAMLAERAKQEIADD